MAFELKPLPFDPADLEPLMSRRTLEFHYGKHHAGYVKKLNELTKGTPFADMTLEAIIQSTAGKNEQKQIFNNAAQVWNHDFFWQCLKPSGGVQPKGPFAEALKREFGDVNQFVDKFAKAAVAQFGSGYAWLVLDKGKLKIVTTHDAEQPMQANQQALLTCDVWEHAYYLDYQNEREKFVRTVVEKLVNWPLVGSRFEQFAAVA
jgi:superoxide dismutase, Fe-Mn family